MISTTPGDTYSLSFYLANPGGGTPNYFAVTFGNSTFSFTNFGVAFSWQQFTMTTVASGTETPLQFTFQNDPGYWFLDNVQVQQQGAGTVPEPSTLAMFGTGALGLAGVIRRKFRV
jgi:PEP-CTERM motif-containing protein